MTYSIDGATYTNTTGIFTNVAAANLLRLKMLQCISAPTSVTINAQPDKTRSITVDPVCNTDRTLTIDLNSYYREPLTGNY
jgi:hypothetical protein